MGDLILYFCVASVIFGLAGLACVFAGAIWVEVKDTVADPDNNDNVGAMPSMPDGYVIDAQFEDLFYKSFYSGDD